MSAVPAVRVRTRAAPIQSPRLRLNSEGPASIDAQSRLAATAASLRNGTLGPEDRDLLATMIERVACGEDPAAALGIKRGPGQRSWGTRTALDQRDLLLREAAERFLGGMSVAAQAQHLHVQLTRYSATAWARERVCEECPDRHQGTIHELFWRVLKLHDRVLSARSLRQILAAN